MAAGELVGDATKRRLFAASVDNLLAMIVAAVSASPLSVLPSAAMGVAVAVYLAYFLVQEGTWSRTVGKRLFGLRVCRLNGAPAGWAVAGIRTAMRILEVNPVVLGGLPAAVTGAISKRHQRVGDMLSGSVVVRAAVRPTDGVSVS